MVLRCLPFLEHLLAWPWQLVDGQASSDFSSKEGFEPKTGIPVSNGEERLSSWDTLKELLEAHPEVPSQSISKARLRLFGDDKKERLTLYRDDSGWCPYSEKVWLTLEEKQISYAVRTVNLAVYGTKADWYYEINPLGLVPAIDHESTIVTDSLNVIRYIEDNFPDHKPLWPAKGTSERKWIDSLLHLDGELIAAVYGNSNWDRLSEIDKVLDKYEEALQAYEGPWFFGHEFSGADIYFATIFERVAPLAPYFAGYHLRFSGKWPHVDAWFDELLTRRSYQLIKSDDYTTIHDRVRALSYKVVELPEGSSWRAKIDGTDGSWDLPLGPVKLPLGSDDGTGANGKKEEAAKTLVFNHENVTLFALRGVSGSDASKYLEKVDLALRFAAHALLVGVENAGRVPNEILIAEVAEAVEYLRDHVGVVRDMTFPAARQFRAYLHWLAKTIKEELKQREYLQAIRYVKAAS